MKNYLAKVNYFLVRAKEKERLTFNHSYIQSREEHRRVQTSERKTYTSKLSKALTEAGKATVHSPFIT